MDIFIEDWNEESLEKLIQKLEKIKSEIEEKQEEKEENITGRILIEDETGEILEKYYRRGIEETNAYIFQNTLMDLVEEIGESVELEQKVAVLVEVLKELICKNK